ncbi:MAG: hypothetical protein NZ561_11565 [Phycisphaerae bacterium]|nr:hypothetical protein [Phycisphaerae bacterium]MDW8262260.1 hypothetical protein [Phycisphaerales bacterium]
MSLFLAASTSWGQIVSLVKRGDTVPGVGNVTLIQNLSVNNSGQWLVEADTDGPTTGDVVLLKNGNLFLREGQPLPGNPPGSVTLSSFDAVNLNNSSVFGGNLFLAGTGSTSNDSGVYQDANLVMQEGTISAAPQFSPNTPYIGWFETKLNDNGQHLVMASVDDPSIPTTVDRAIVRWNVAPNGTLLSETVIAKEGDVLPGTTQAVVDFGTSPHAFDFNNAGTAMFRVDGDGPTSEDFLVYVGGTLVAQEGRPSPVAGRSWAAAGLGGSRMALNNSGDFVYTGTLDGDPASDLIIIKNNNKFIQEGDSLPAIGAFTFTAFGTGPVDIDDQGNVLWFGDWNDPDTTRDTGLFLNDQLIVQKGVTMIDGLLVTSIASGDDAFAISDNGLYVIFEGVLQGGIDGAFLVTIPEPPAVGPLLLLAARFVRRRRESSQPA